MQKRQFNSGQSWPLGAVRMTENFLKVDSDSTPSTKNIKALRKHIHTQIGNWSADKPTGLPLVGMGGTIRNLASIQQKEENYPVDIMHGYTLKKDALDNIVEMLISKTTADKMNGSEGKAASHFSELQEGPEVESCGGGTLNLYFNHKSASYCK